MQNVADCVSRQRRAATKVTEAQVIELRERRFAGETLSSLAREFGLSEGTVCTIAKGHKWASVGGPRTVMYGAGAKVQRRKRA